MLGPWSVSGLHHAAASKHESSALWMDALLPTPAPLVDGGPMQPCGPTWTTMPLEPCRGRSPRLIVPPTAWTTVGYVAFWLPLDLMGPTLGAGLQPGTLQHLLRRQQLLATVVALLAPPFFWQTSRYFGMCPKSLVRRGPNALPSSGRSSAPQLGRSLVGPAHAPESRASTCTTWRGPTATAGRAIHSSAVWAVAGR